MREGTEPASFDREDVLETLEDAIDDVRKRTKSREIKTAEDERILISWYRTLGTLTGQYRKLRKDADLDEIEENVELLQEVTGLQEQKKRQ